MMAHIGTSYTRNSGYYVNDNRVSGGKKEEDDVKTCTHCQAILLMRRWKHYGGFCRQCNAPICGRCGERMEVFGCEPFLKKMEREFGMAESIRKALEWGPAPPGAVIVSPRHT